MKNMLIYYCKKRWYVILIITIIILFINIVSIDPNNFIEKRVIYPNGYNDDYHIYVDVAGTPPIGYITFFAAALATIIPMFEFYFKMRKISIDQLYSLPIKREKLYLTKYIVGLIETLIPIIINYFVILLIVICNEHMFNYLYLVLYLPVLIFFTIILYTIVSFAYTRANTYFDGIINVLFYTFILVLPFALLALWGIDQTWGLTWFFTYSPITCSHRLFSNIISNQDSSYKIWDTVSFITFTVIAIISFILFLKLNKTDKSEDSMQLSESWFSYKVMLPAYCILGCMLAADIVIVLLLIIISTFLLYVIYKRSFKLSKKELLYLSIIFVISIALSIISGQIVYN